MRAIGGALLNVFIVIAAAVIGFGVPAGWVWIGSQLQGESGATELKFSVAVAVLAGIIVTYIVVLYLAGFVISWLAGAEEGERQTGHAREPWLRGMTDTRAVRPKRSGGVEAVERLFVVTTLLVTAAFWVWFLLFADSPLPSQ